MLLNTLPSAGAPSQRMVQPQSAVPQRRHPNGEGAATAVPSRLRGSMTPDGRHSRDTLATQITQVTRHSPNSRQSPR